MQKQNGVDLVSLPDFFVGPPDRCERLISSLQYCSEDGAHQRLSGCDHLYMVLLLVRNSLFVAYFQFFL